MVIGTMWFLKQAETSSKLHTLLSCDIRLLTQIAGLSKSKNAARDFLRIEQCEALNPASSGIMQTA